MTTAQQADEIEALRVLMAHYARWGDTQQWDKFGSLFHDDAVVIIDAGPRPNPEADPRVEIHGREAFIAGQSASLDGVHTAHNMFLPEITIDDDTHAHATWGLHDYIKTPVVNFNGYGHQRAPMAPRSHPTNPTAAPANRPKGVNVTDAPHRTAGRESDTMSRPGRLAGKVVLLTGIGAGQGRAAALLFAREEALVVGCNVNADGAAETVALANADGLDITSMAPVDLADPVAARRWVEDGVGVHGRIDIVYNNAANVAIAPFPELSLEQFQFTVANEIGVVWHVCQASWNHLAASRGVIISTASIAGLIGTRDLKQAAHSMGKGGVIALTRQLAAEGAAHGIRANSISPGVIAIPSVQETLDRLGDDAPMMSMIRTTFDGHPGKPEDIADAALFLASDEARYINGENLVVDGGATVILG